jgi:hypothetical protein
VRSSVVLWLALAAAPAPAAADSIDERPDAWLGIGFEPAGRAARVIEVHPSTAASHAGLQPGDEIIAIDGDFLSDTLDLGKLISSHGIGARLRVTFYRGGRIMHVWPRLTVRPTTEELVHRRMIDHVVPAVPVYDRDGLLVPAVEYTRRAQIWLVFDARCESCADHVAAMRLRLAADDDGDDGVPRAPLRVVVVGAAVEAAAYLSRVPVVGTVWRMDRDDLSEAGSSGLGMRAPPLGRRFLSGVNVERDGVVLVLDRQGVVRFATSLSSGESAHDGACGAAARLTRSWRR